MKYSAHTTCLLLCLLASFFTKAVAQEEEYPTKTLSPYFVVLSDNPEVDKLPLKSTAADVKIVGTIADVKITQKYVNTGTTTLEAIYTFPMSTKAAVYGMTMTIGKRKITAQIEEKQKARQEYEEAKEEGKRVSLLEQNRPNVFTMNTANIIPGDTIVVELNYTEVLVPEKGNYSFVYPTVVGPRYSGKESDPKNPDNQFVESPYTKEGVMPTYTFDFSINVHSAMPIANIDCSTHKMDINFKDINHVALQLNKTEKNGGNRDLIVNFSLQGKEIESGVMLYEGKDENFFLMMVQPPQRVLDKDIPPREYIFIVDVSGSMHGKPLDISKNLMRNLVLNLKPTDMFNVVLFSGRSALLNETSLPANDENIRKAIAFIDKQEGYGGTEVLGALRMANAIPRANDDVSRTFVIATDGYVDVEQEAFRIIRENKHNTNFFAFGIGSSVNRYIIEGMAFAGNGEPMFITDFSNTREQVERFRNYINTPVLTRIKIDSKNFDIYDIEPAGIPDLMAERPIVIFGKYKGKPSGTITLSGKTGRKNYRQTFDISKLAADTTNQALRYLWARERIKYLDYMENPGRGWWRSERDSSISKEITQLGLKYGLMTNYTSFIAIDEVVVEKDGKQVTVKQPLPLPEGVSEHAVGRGEDGMVKHVGFAPKRRTNSVNGIAVVEDALLITAETEEYKDIPTEEEIFIVVEVSPEFPGGLDSLYNFIYSNLRYPQSAMRYKLEGRVFITFVVEKDGSITNVRILRDIGGGCGQEAKRVVEMMPKWIPGKQNGKTVRVQYNLPITFKLNEEDKAKTIDATSDSISNNTTEMIDVFPANEVIPFYQPNGEKGVTGFQNIIEFQNITDMSKSDEETEIILSIDPVETQPQFPGGEDSLYNFIYSNLRYPELAICTKMEGRVFITFVVEKDGSITNVRILRDIGGGCGQEAKRVVEMMPKWIPGKQNGKTVRVQYNLPVTFKLNEEDKAKTIDDFPFLKNDSVSNNTVIRVIFFDLDQLQEEKEQTEPEDTVEEYVEEDLFIEIEVQPQFPGGEDSLYSFIYSNLRYPQEAIDNGIEGKVYVTFAIEKDGSITGIKLLRDIGYGCGEEAMRIIRMMPKWTPGKDHLGNIMGMQYNLPIKFEFKQ